MIYEPLSAMHNQNWIFRYKQKLRIKYKQYKITVLNSQWIKVNTSEFRDADDNGEGQTLMEQ